jgi:hypothetical protein
MRFSKQLLSLGIVKNILNNKISEMEQAFRAVSETNEEFESQAMLAIKNCDRKLGDLKANFECQRGPVNFLNKR